MKVLSLRLTTPSLVVVLLFGVIGTTVQQQSLTILDSIKQHSGVGNSPVDAFDDVCDQGHSDVSAICFNCAAARTIVTAAECCSHRDAFELCVALATGDYLGEAGGDDDDNDDIMVNYNDYGSQLISSDNDNDDDNKMAIELQNGENEEKRKSPFLGKRRSPFLGKRRSPFLGKRRSPFLGKRRSPFLGKRRSPFLGKRSSSDAHL